MGVNPLNTHQPKNLLLRQRPIILGLFLTLGLVIFGPTLFYPFAHDDKVFILANPAVTQGQDLLTTFFKPTYTTDHSPVINQYYRPLLEVFNRFQFLCFGTNPVGYHLLNVFFHSVNGFLIFLLLSTLTENFALALGVGLLFLLHPVQSEAVASIAGQSNTLGTLLSLSGLQCYLLLVRESVQKRRWLFATGFVCSWVAALLIKEQGVIVPFLIASMLVLFFTKLQQRKMRPSLIMMGLAVIAYLSWRKYLAGVVLPDIMTTESLVRLAQIPKVLGMYIGLLVFPQGLHYYRSINLLENDFAGYLYFTIFIIFLILSFRKRTQRDRKLLAFGGAWFLIAILPTLLFPIVNEYSFILAFEHFLYLPLIGFATFIMALVWPLFHSSRLNKMATTVFILLLAVLSGLTIRQNASWSKESTLFKQAVTFEPRMGRLRLLLGEAYYNEQKFDQASQEYTTAIHIFNGYLQEVTDPAVKEIYRQFLGEGYAQLAQTNDAQGNDSAALANYNQALVLGSPASAIYNNLGMIFLRQNDIKKACSLFQQAAATGNSNVAAQTNWGICLAQSGQLEEARRLWQNVLTHQPDFLPARQNLERLPKAPSRGYN